MYKTIRYQSTKPSPILKSYLDYNFNEYRKIKKFSDLPQHFGYNQHMAIDNELRENMRATLWKFKAPIRYAFAYGSGVFSQGSASQKSTPQVDMVFGVSYPEHWHWLNMKQYPHHYSGLRWLGSNVVSHVQDDLGAGMYFNPYVDINGMKIKYGVVNINTLLRDLRQWDTLYLAGRLHKPVKILRDDPRIRFLNQSNLISVLRTSLLLLPDEFTEYELYTTIAGISYMGDPRMTYGENPNKVKNIVDNQFLNFRRLYSPLMDELPNLELISTTVTEKFGDNIEVALMRQDMDLTKRGNMLVRLPPAFKNKIYAVCHQLPHEEQFCNDIDKQMVSNNNFQQKVTSAVKHTVAWPSTVQSIKGIFTAGLLKSISYAGEKLKKYYA